MKAHYLNKKNNDSLIVFFCGWSFDETPFLKCNFGNFDVLIIYDYNQLEIPEELNNTVKYKNKYLIAWSMGVFVAFLNKNLFENFDKKIAINGTVFPVHNDFGIPEKIFKLTLIHAKKGLEGKFYANLFDNEEDYQKYLQNPVQRSVENRVSELQNLDKLAKQTQIKYEKFYDKAIICKNDKIIPPQNQINCHKELGIPIIEVDCGHFPFYKFQSFEEMILCQ